MFERGVVGNIGVEDLSSITAAILAGGRGTRLQSVVADCPKVLAAVRGRPFLSYLLDQLVAAGVREVVLCTGYMAEQVRGAFGDKYRSLRLSLSHAAEVQPVGAIDAYMTGKTASATPQPMRWLTLCISEVTPALTT